MKEPLLRKVDCLRIPVPELEAGLTFYRDQLGHDVLWRAETMVGLRMPESDAEIVLSMEPEGMEVDLLVASAGAGAAAFEQAGGRVIVPPFDIQIGKCTVVADPWGNQLVLLDMSKGRLVTDESGHVVGTQGSP